MTFDWRRACRGFFRVLPAVAPHRSSRGRLKGLDGVAELSIRHGVYPAVTPSHWRKINGIEPRQPVTCGVTPTFDELRALDAVVAPVSGGSGDVPAGGRNGVRMRRGACRITGATPCSPLRIIEVLWDAGGGAGRGRRQGDRSFGHRKTSRRRSGGRSRPSR